MEKFSGSLHIECHILPSPVRRTNALRLVFVRSPVRGRGLCNAVTSQVGWLVGGRRAAAGKVAFELINVRLRCVAWRRWNRPTLQCPKHSESCNEIHFWRGSLLHGHESNSYRACGRGRATRGPIYLAIGHITSPRAVQAPLRLRASHSTRPPARSMRRLHCMTGK